MARRRGCALKGEGYDVLKRTQWGYATNPNVGGVVMVGGCEGQISARFKEASMACRNPKRSAP